MSAQVLDQGWQIGMFRLSCVIRNLRLEVTTGMSLARNAPTVARLRDEYGITARTKKAALAELEDLMAECEAGTFDPSALPGAR
jgi:hypothetical protein